jgi:hypothetical protein
VEEGVGGRGGIKDQGYQAGIDTVASWQVLPIVYDLHSIVNLTSCSDFLREQMRGFHDLLRHKPTCLFILLGWS